MPEIIRHSKKRNLKDLSRENNRETVKQRGEQDMKFIYPAVFRKTEKGTWHAHFPDLACCEAEGDTLDDAIDRANEAAYDWISLELSEDDCNLPPISEESDICREEGDIVRNISVNIRFYEGWDE